MNKNFYKCLKYRVSYIQDLNFSYQRVGLSLDIDIGKLYKKVIDFYLNRRKGEKL